MLFNAVYYSELKYTVLMIYLPLLCGYSGTLCCWQGIVVEWEWECSKSALIRQNLTRKLLGVAGRAGSSISQKPIAPLMFLLNFPYFSILSYGSPQSSPPATSGMMNLKKQTICLSEGFYMKIACT